MSTEITTLRCAARYLRGRADAMKATAKHQTVQTLRREYELVSNETRVCASILDDLANMIERDDAPRDWRELVAATPEPQGEPAHVDPHSTDQERALTRAGFKFDEVGRFWTRGNLTIQTVWGDRGVEWELLERVLPDSWRSTTGTLAKVLRAAEALS